MTSKKKPIIYNPSRLYTIKEGDEEVESPQSDTSENSDDSDTISAIDAKREALLLERIAKITGQSSSIHIPSPVVAAGELSIQHDNSEAYQTPPINPNVETILGPDPVQISVIALERDNNIYSEWVLYGIIGLSFTIALNYIYNYDVPSR